MNAVEARRVVEILAAAFPNAPFTDQTAALWESELAGIQRDVGQAAARRITRDDQWFPTIARFREVVGIIQPRSPSHEHCDRCNGAGFVCVHEASNSYMPCPSCRQETHAKWAKGDYSSRFVHLAPHEPSAESIANVRELVAETKAKLGRRSA